MPAHVSVPSSGAVAVSAAVDSYSSGDPRRPPSGGAGYRLPVSEVPRGSAMSDDCCLRSIDGPARLTSMLPLPFCCPGLACLAATTSPFHAVRSPSTGFGGP